MPPAVSRFGPQTLGTPFQHLQQAQSHHHSSQHQPPGSAGLPPLSFNSHHNFAQANTNPNINPFAPTGNTNGLAVGFGSGAGLGGGGTGLASHAAVMGFAHGAQMQQQAQKDAMRRGSGGVGGGKGQMKGRIRDVWRNNLAQEMHILRGLVEKYPYISMVSRPQLNLKPQIAGSSILENQVLTVGLGYRVPRDCCSTDGLFHYQGRLPLPNAPLQRRPSTSYTTGNHTFL